MEDCIFCKIVKGEIPAEKVWEDSKFLAFLDANPRIKGHSLVIPKKHFDTFMDLDKETSSNYFDAIKKTAETLIKKYNADGFNIVLNNGESAGQIIPHAHFHIIPRKKGDKKILDLFNVK